MSYSSWYINYYICVLNPALFKHLCSVADPPSAVRLDFTEKFLEKLGFFQWPLLRQKERQKRPLAGWRAVREGWEPFFKACTLNSGILAGNLMEDENWLYQSNQKTRQDIICTENSDTHTPGLTVCTAQTLEHSDIASQVTNTVFQMFLS